MMKNDFEKEEKYRLFRSVQEILHPSISKKNISDYEIVFEEEYLPVRIFYPKKVSSFAKVIIFIHGNGEVTDCHQKYSKICREFSSKIDCLVIAIEYEQEQKKASTIYQDVYKTVKYLYERLEMNNIPLKDIILVGDSTGGNIITGINYMNNEDISISQEILFYPTLNLEFNKDTSLVANQFNSSSISSIKKYASSFLAKEEKKSSLFKPLENTVKNLPKTLLLVGKVDILKNDAKKYKEMYEDKVHYVEIPFSGHGFLKDMDSELSKEVFDELRKFIFS